MANEITSVSNSGEVAYVYLTHAKWGKVKLNIFPSGNIEVELADADADPYDTKYYWYNSSAYIGDAIEYAVSRRDNR